MAQASCIGGLLPQSESESDTKDTLSTLSDDESTSGGGPSFDDESTKRGGPSSACSKAAGGGKRHFKKCISISGHVIKSSEHKRIAHGSY
jgi:hypothetical protein